MKRRKAFLYSFNLLNDKLIFNNLFLFGYVRKLLYLVRINYYFFPSWRYYAKKNIFFNDMCKPQKKQSTSLSIMKK